MESYPAIRRHPRTPRPDQPDAPPRQTYAQLTLVIITDDPAFREPRVDENTQVWCWTAARRARAPNQFAGDPTAARTYAWTRELPDVSAIVALLDPKHTAAAMAALQEANPLAAVLVVSASQLPAGAGSLTRPVDWHAALRRSLEIELGLLETLKRVHALRAFAADAPVVPILVHQDPDPDALASALAIRALLQRPAQHAPILTLDAMTRPENRRMAELLDIQVTQVSLAELEGFDRIICVDMQPRELLSSPRSDSRPRARKFAIIDHHPFEGGYPAEYIDIRPRYGATATILTEYLRADDERRINKWLATGLVYAIKTDTDNLSRGVSAADVAAYTFLLERVAEPLLRRIERPALSAQTAGAYGRALAGLLLRNDLAVAYLGRISVDQSHILADLADFCLTIEEATWAAAAAIVEERLVITLRHLGGEPGAGQLARALSAAGGAGGGHATMARAVLPLLNEWGALPDAPLEIGSTLLLERLTAELERIRSV